MKTLVSSLYKISRNAFYINLSLLTSFVLDKRHLGPRRVDYHSFLRINAFYRH